MEYEHITHSFKPVYDENSRILILGTLPSVKSRENNFYYGQDVYKRQVYKSWLALIRVRGRQYPTGCFMAVTEQ